jgi:hypothetical protein
MAGPSTELETTWRSLAVVMPKKEGIRAIISALAPIPTTAKRAVRRFDATMSTSQPPGSWLRRPATLPNASTRPISAWFHFCVVR